MYLMPYAMRTCPSSYDHRIGIGHFPCRLCVPTRATVHLMPLSCERSLGTTSMPHTCYGGGQTRKSRAPITVITYAAAVGADQWDAKVCSDCCRSGSVRWGVKTVHCHH